MRIMLKLSYNGGRYYGWQNNKLHQSIEKVLLDVFYTLFQEKILIEGASRTDRGVHALGQVFHCDLPKPFEIKKLKKALNQLLPLDIRILSIQGVSPSFHATVDAKSKIYLYKVHTKEDPFLYRYSWYVQEELNIELMKKNGELIVGLHDFKSLCNQKNRESYLSTERKILSVSIEKEKDSLYFFIHGEKFLYKMVRNIVGTLVDIGRGKLQKDIQTILSSKDRKKAGVTAPACGLYLKEIFY